jgi:DNA polymerase-3 subunit beta
MLFLYNICIVKTAGGFPMKLTLNKKLFLQSWNLAERSTSSPSTMNILSSVLLKASEEEVILQATDIRTSIICKAEGVSVMEGGDAVFPIKMVGELFKKVPGEEFSIEIEDGKAVMKAGRAKYSFSTYPVEEFPKLPSSGGASLFCRIPAIELAMVLDEGTLAASTREEFPLYLSSANFQTSGGFLNIVSTDTKRLALSRVTVSDSAESESYLLPMQGVKEVQRILTTMDPDSEVEILMDDSQFYFKTDSLEFTVRRVESRFPPYEKILPKESTTEVLADRGNLISALERVDVIVRDFNRMAVMDIEPMEPMVIRGKAPDFGQAREEVAVDAEGEKMKIAVNSKFFMDALKVMRDAGVRLSFTGSAGHMVIRRPDGEGFLCLIAPMNFSEEEMEMGDNS